AEIFERGFELGRHAGMAVLVRLLDAAQIRGACLVGASETRKERAESAPRVALILLEVEVRAQLAHRVVGASGLLVFDRETEAQARVVGSRGEHALERGDPVRHGESGFRARKRAPRRPGLREPSGAGQSGNWNPVAARASAGRPVITSIIASISV